MFLTGYTVAMVTHYVEAQQHSTSVAQGVTNAEYLRLFVLVPL